MADWLKIGRDTDWLDVTAEMEAGANHVSGRLLLRRRRDEGMLLLDDLVVDKSGTSTLLRIGTGWRPFSVRRDDWWVPNSAVQSDAGTVNISTSGYVVGYLLVPGRVMSGRIVWDIAQPWPSTYPGTEAQL